MALFGGDKLSPHFLDGLSLPKQNINKNVYLDGSNLLSSLSTGEKFISGKAIFTVIWNKGKYTQNMLVAMAFSK